MIKCEKCGKILNYDHYKARGNSYLTDLYLNGLSVDLCKDCELELVKWLGFSHDKLKDDYMIITREEA